MDAMMIMETNPIQFVGFTAVTSAIALALATGIVVGVTFDIYGSPLSYSFAGILAAGSFGFGLTPWIILGEDVHLNQFLNIALLVLSVIIGGLLLRIRHLVKTEGSAKLPVASYLSEKEVRRRLSAFLPGQDPAPSVSPAK